MDAGASASARPAGLPVHDARPVGCAHPASRARPAGAASHSRKGAGRGLDRWRPPLDFLCDGNRLVRDVRCPGGTILHLWRPWWTRGVSDGTRLDIERCAACGYTLLVETRDDGTALEWELDETDYRNDNRKGKR